MIKSKIKSGKLGLAMATALVLGNMIGSGIFLLPASLAIFGGISILGWVFTSVGSLFLALVFSRLSRIHPAAGGPYAYAKEGFGEFAGFLVAWGYWIAVWVGNAAIAVAMVSYLGVFWPALANNPAWGAAVSIIVVWILAAVNISGVRNVGFIAIFTTILKILPILALIIFGFFYFQVDHFRPLNLSGESNFSAISTTAALTLWAFLGLESATVPADDIDNPGQTISKATIYGTLGAALIYILATAAVMGIVSPAILANSTAPFADAGRIMWGDGAYYIIALGAVISCFGALNGWTLMAAQVSKAAADDGLLPEIFSRGSKWQTPAAGIVIASILVTILISMNYFRGMVHMFTFIILLATLTTLLPYLLNSMAEVMIIIKRKETGKKTQLRKALYLGVPAFLYSTWAIAGSGEETVFWGIFLLISGLPFYVWLKWKKSVSQNAK